MPTDAPRNIPVPDALNAVREQIRALQARELELRQLIIANPDIRMGANWLAEVKEVETNRLDVKELRAMHKDLLEEYTFPQKTVRIELSAIDAETGEIIPARRARQTATESQQP
jgi:hypothetical protein